MDTSERLILILLGGAALILLTAGFLTRLRGWRRRTPEELERRRRLEVCRSGRITSGEIVDMIEPETSKRGPWLLLYRYEVTGATYDAAQDIAALPDAVAAASRLAGRVASVKYDPKQPSDSIIVCEEWSGLPGFAPKAAAENPGIPSPAPAVKNS